MRTTLKRTLALVLAVIMLVSTLGVSAFADTGKYKYYTVVGDSNASGYGTEAYFRNAAEYFGVSEENFGKQVKEGDLIPGSYPAIIAEELGIENVAVHSHCAWRTNEFLHMIAPDCGVEWDSFFLRALNFVKRETVDENSGKSEAMIADIKKADIMTIDFGSNDFFSFTIYETYNDFADELEALLKNLQAIADDPVLVLNEIFTAAEKLGLLKDIIDDFKAHFLENVAEYKQNMVIVLNEIRKLNPDAKLVVMGVFSPISIDPRINHEMVISLNSKIDRDMKQINVYLKSLCDQYDNCLYVDNPNPECFGIKVLDVEKLLALDEDVKYSAVQMVHPSEYGHKYIAKQILAALTAESYVPVVTARYSTYVKNNTLNWNTVDGAVKYKVYRAYSENGNYTYIGSSTKDIFYDYLTLPGITYYYKVCAVLDKSGEICSDFSAPVSIKAKLL